LSRRQLLRGAAASIATASLPFRASAQSVCHEAKPCAQPPCEPTPNFAMKQARLLAGLRPHRDDTYRLAREEIEGKFFVHNYGHGGAGITMSLGCAEQVKAYVDDIIKEHKDAAASGIAVLGGGVMALTTATTLAKAYHPKARIDIYAKDFYRTTTSHVAGGQWAPSSVKWDEKNPKAVDAFKRVLASSLTQFKALGAGYGVSPKTNYSLYRRSGLETAHSLGLIERDTVERLPFAAMNCSGYAYKTLLVEPPIFLKRLHNELIAKLGIPAFHKQTFAKPAAGQKLSPDIARLKQKIVINCTGLGAGDLFNDPRVSPIKGHLVLLPAQKLNYLFSGYECNDWVQYVFPRQDGVIVGGTYQDDRPDTKTNAKVAEHMIGSLKALFAGALAPPCDGKILPPTEVEKQSDKKIAEATSMRPA
jgi:glycine/D-amino acid oxidase-like deaminating enzyme